MARCEMARLRERSGQERQHVEGFRTQRQSNRSWCSSASARGYRSWPLCGASSCLPTSVPALAVHNLNSHAAPFAILAYPSEQLHTLHPAQTKATMRTYGVVSMLCICPTSLKHQACAMRVKLLGEGGGTKVSHWRRMLD